MKIKKIYKIAFILILYVVLQSRSGGPGAVQNLQVTGAPGSTGMAAGQPGTCANSGCHNGGSFNPSLSVQLLEAGNPVTSYEPGKTYTLKVVTTPGTGSPARYGFQALSLNEANEQAGEWGALSGSMQQINMNNRDYIEHSAPSVSNIFEIPWVAPSAGAGAVTFYSASVAANGNGGTSGDAVASSSLTIEEDAFNNTFNLQKQYANIRVLPNPVRDLLNLQITSRMTGNHKIRIMDVAGNMLKELPVAVQIGINKTEIGVSDLLPGYYIVQLCGEAQLAATPMLKI